MHETVSYELIVHDEKLRIISGTQDISFKELCSANGFDGATSIYSSDSYDDVFDMQEFLIGDGTYPNRYIDNSSRIKCLVVEEDYYNALDSQCVIKEMAQL